MSLQTLIVHRSTDAPIAPKTGDLWCDTITMPCTIRQYNGSSWEVATTSLAIVSPPATITPIKDATSVDYWAAGVDTAILVLLLCWMVMDRCNFYFRKSN